MNNDLKKVIKKLYEDNFLNNKFVPGETQVPISGKVFNDRELVLGVEAILDGWWTEGRFAKEFEQKFGEYLNLPFVTLVNSGSSANLIAFSALTSKSHGERALKPGDEVITAATGFPTTVNPLIQYGCVPVFVDIDLETKNVAIADVKKAITKNTKAIMIAHTLGNPFGLKEIIKLAKDNNLWIIEDCCDALGSTYEGKKVGTFGDIATFSFYPAHHITMGEGGAVVTKNPLLFRSIRQFRDWGRDCWCPTGKDNTCGKRFCWKMGKLPLGYDHKYIYSQIGYNLKLTDMQAAIGLAQLEKLDGFIQKRKDNFNKLYEFFHQYRKYFILPEHEKESDPSWFGFMLVIKDNKKFNRLELVKFLDEKKIGTRNLFAGNLLKHPAYMNIKSKKIGTMKNSDKIMNDGFWIGVYPGIDNVMLNYVQNSFSEFIHRYESEKKT